MTFLKYVPPASHLQVAIQYPLDARFAERVVNAYARDAAIARHHPDDMAAVRGPVIKRALGIIQAVQSDIASRNTQEPT